MSEVFISMNLMMRDEITTIFGDFGLNEINVVYPRFFIIFSSKKIPKNLQEVDETMPQLMRMPLIYKC